MCKNLPKIPCFKFSLVSFTWLYHFNTQERVSDLPSSKIEIENKNWAYRTYINSGVWCGIIRPSKLESLYEYVVLQLNCPLSGTNNFEGLSQVSKKAGSYKCLGQDNMRTT